MYLKPDLNQIHYKLSYEKDSYFIYFLPIMVMIYFAAFCFLQLIVLILQAFLYAVDYPK